MSNERLSSSHIDIIRTLSDKIQGNNDVWSVSKRRESYEVFFNDFSKGSVACGFTILNNMSYSERDNLRRALFYVLVEMENVKFAYPLATYAKKMLGSQDYQYAVAVGESLGCQSFYESKTEVERCTYLY